MIRIKEAIVVEGKYDKNTLSQLVDTVILETHGFSIFQDKDKLALLRTMADKRGLIILTDSDGAGFVIRNHIKGAIPPDKVKHAYIPNIHGKERRKRHWGGEKQLGVEGMTQDILVTALRRSGATFLDEEDAKPKSTLSKTDLYLCGLTGGENSSRLRQALFKELNLPNYLSPNALLPILNALYAKEDLLTLVEKLKEREAD